MSYVFTMRSFLITALLANIACATPHPRSKTQITAQTHYDYVVVGGGAAGLTVANRLSEQPNTTVLVIEAGDFDKNEDFVTIPGLAGGAIGTKYDWNITYAQSESVNGRNVSIPLGKVVGGSTKLNRMVFDRGSKSDYDRWAALGNHGWDWKSLLPYFKKNEIFTPPPQDIAAEYNITYDENFHGSSGCMHSTYAPFFWPLTKTIIQATKELGIHMPVDQASGDAIGGYFCPHNQDPTTQTRSSAREAYYETAKGRPNFEILTGYQVTRIITKKTSALTRITGVEFASSKGADRHVVSVDKEVVLAAGSVHTPQILQLSGIGNPKLLAKIGVETKVNLSAVGQNFQDHVLLTVVNSIKTNSLVSSDLTTNTTFAAAALKEYKQSKLGPYTSPTGEFLKFLPLTTYSNASAQIHAAALKQNSAIYLPAKTPAEVQKGYSQEVRILNENLLSDESANLEIIWADGVILLGLQHPYSRGSVEALTNNVFDGVTVDSGYLRNPLDVKFLIEGVRFARKLAATAAVKELQPFEVVPGANVTSDAALEQFARSNSETFYHPAGSCKMGARELGGVVDSKLRVYGVTGLRIADASVIPLLPATHLMTTVYAIAEKAADIIKQG
ncbi:hypothetical protein Q7P35_003018 [Cladosporium inversicolor]